MLEYSNIKICLSCKESSISTYEEINGISSILKSISRVNVNIEDFTDTEKDNIIERYKSYYNVSLKEDVIKELKSYCNNGFLFRIIFETYSGKELIKPIEDIAIIEKYIEIISKNYNVNHKELLFSLITLGELFINEKKDWPMLLVEEMSADSLLRDKGCKIDINELVNMNILQRYCTEETNYIDFNFKPLSYYVITILYGELNKRKEKEFKRILFKLNSNRRGKEALRWYDKYLKPYQYTDIYNFKKKYGVMIIQEYRDIVNKHFYNIKDKFELGEDINNIGIALDSEYSCVINVYGFFTKKHPTEDVRFVNFREENVLTENGMSYSCHTMSAINVRDIIKDKVKKITEHRRLNEEDCKYLNIEYILNKVFYFGKYYGLNYKYEKCNFIPNFNEFLPLDLNELSKKIIIFNIEMLKNMEIISNDLESEELYKQLITGEIDIPECNYSISGKGKLPIYDLVNRINNYIYNFSETVIDKTHLILPQNINQIKKSSWVSDIIIESFSEEELKEYLNDLLKKYIDEYILIVEKNFPILKESMIYYNLFKNGVTLELYLYKNEKNPLGKYSKKLFYRYNNENINTTIVHICNEEYVKKIEERNFVLCVTGVTNILFYDNYINNELTRHMVLSNMIYDLLESDLKKILDNEDAL